MMSVLKMQALCCYPNCDEEAIVRIHYEQSHPKKHYDPQELCRKHMTRSDENGIRFNLGDVYDIDILEGGKSQ